MEKILQLQIQTHGFRRAELISIKGLSMMLELVCDVNRVHGSAAISAMCGFVTDLLSFFARGQMLRN